MSKTESKIVEFRSPAGALLRQVAQCDQADPWFVAKDTLQALGLTRSALRKLDDDEKGEHLMLTLGGPQKTAIVSEPGLCKLMARSRKPEAKAWWRWVTHEVLPSIRRTGSYSTQAAPAFDLRLLTEFVGELLKPILAQQNAIVQQLSDLKAQLATASTSFASLHEANGLRRGLDRIAAAAALAGAYKSRRAARTGLENRVRTACGWPRDTGGALNRMPAACVPYAQRELAEIEREYSRFENVTQLNLSGTK